MKSFASKVFLATFGLALAAAPLTASAAQVGIGVNIGGPGYVVHGGYRPAPPPPPRYRYHRYSYAPAPAYREGYYGWAPGGYRGYYSRGHWFAHRRRNNGVWIYF